MEASVTMPLKRSLARMGVCRTTRRLVRDAAAPRLPEFALGRDDLID